MGVSVHAANKQVLLRELEPRGPHGAHDHFEIDFVAVHGATCVIGEVTARKDKREVERKYAKFRHQFDVIRRVPPTDETWQMLGVSRREARAEFTDVTEFRAMFIATNVEPFDVDLAAVPNVALFYRADWSLLRAYAENLGAYAANHLLHRLDMAAGVNEDAIAVTKQHHSLVVAKRRRIVSQSAETANVFTFEISPYKLLPIAQVFRRDELPNLSVDTGGDYQRPLITAKLRHIRQHILKPTEDFLFPSSILVVLGEDCEYQERRGRLLIPSVYGNVEVIDGQHRLFSYADIDVEKQHGRRARILVTAVLFAADVAERRRYSARTFVEINTNQTRIASSHADAIAYGVLGDTTPKALAAAVLLRVNEEKGASYGIFKTHQTRLGKVAAPTVAVALRPLTSLDECKRLRRPRTPGDQLRARGYEQLFGARPGRMTQAPQLITRATSALKTYFRHARQIFPHDWPDRKPQKKYSSFEFAKVMAGLVTLFDHFVSEGLSWDEVVAQLEVIRANVAQHRGVPATGAMLFDYTNDPGVPSSDHKTRDDFRYFDANRGGPTPITELVRAPRRGRR
jgi:DGQHR domain-containing protein